MAHPNLQYLAPACEQCQLYQGCLTPVMQPAEALVDGICDVLYVGEAPGEEEDARETPFVGRSGKFLHELVDVSGLQHFGAVYTNAVRCRPPNNAQPTARQIKYCQHYLADEIERYNPRLIVMLGNIPLNSILGESGITKWHGALINKGGRLFAPTYHPSYVLRNAGDKSLTQAIIMDFEKMYQAMSGETQAESVADKYDLYLVETVEAAMEMWAVIDKYKYCSFDTESNLGVKPFAEGTHPIMCSFAVKAEDCHAAWAVTFEQPEVVTIVHQILSDPEIGKVLHNGKYDNLVCLAEWDLGIQGIIGDALVLSYLIDSVPGRHGLKELAGKHLGMYEYAGALDEYHRLHPESNPAKGGDNSLVPVELLGEYAALDAVATIELHECLWDQLTPQQVILYYQLMIPAVPALSRMEAAGLVTDLDMVARYLKVYQSVQATYYDAMITDPLLQKYVAAKDKPVQAEYRAKQAKSKRKLKAPATFRFNPNSDNQMRELLFDKKYCGLKPLEKTETGLPSIKWDNIKAYEKDVPFLHKYHLYELLNTMLSTYLRPAPRMIGRDGRTHQTLVQDGTVSGRLASKEPNSQNIPTPEKEPNTLLADLPIKNIFTYWHHNHSGANFDQLRGYMLDGTEGCILAADYSGMELRTKASLADCQGMKEAFMSGKDVHSVVTCKLYHLDFDDFVKRRKAGDPEAISKRYHAKWVNWTLLFGGSHYTLTRLYGIPEREAKALVSTYYEMFPEILTDNERILAGARQDGYVDSKFGRRRYFPYINDRNPGKRNASEREAKNHPIQSAAADILMCSLVVIDDQIQQQQLKTRLMNTVHDSLMLDVYPGELHSVAKLVKSVMEGIKGDWGKQYFPGFDFSWFDIPLVADLEFGHHYGCLEDYHAPQALVG